MSLVELTKANDFGDEYEALVGASDQGILYCRKWWLDAVAPGNYQLLKLEANGRLKAAWPVVAYEDVNGLSIRMPPLTQKLGILFAPSNAKYAERLSEQHRLQAELIDKLPSHSDFYQHFHEGFTNWLPFFWQNYQVTVRYTYLLKDLTDKKRLWDNMRTGARTTIRTAIKQNIRIRETNDLEEFYEVNRLTFVRQNMAVPHSLQLLARVYSACLANAGTRALIAEDCQGKPHACILIVYDRQSSIYLLAGADPQLRASGAQALLQWECIQFASAVSKQFDFEGSMVRGVEAYLRDFGAVQTPYFAISKSASAIAMEVAANNKLTRFDQCRRLAGRVLRKLARIVDS